MQSSIQAVGVSPVGVCAAALLFTHPTGRVLINCGENFQRLSTEWRLRLSKLEDIVITHLTPECVGGLPGLLLTLEGLDSPSVECPTRKAKGALAELDKSAKFGQTFVGVKWLTRKSSIPNIGAHHYRPIIKRRQEGLDDDLEVFGNSLLDIQDLESYRKMETLRHTVRGIRIWGPKGLMSYLQLFVLLCGRLQKLCVEVFEFEETTDSLVVPYTPLPEISQIVFDANLLVMPRPSSEEQIAKRRKIDNETEELPCVFQRSTTCCPLIYGRGEKQLGRFLIDKALALKIPKGPMYAMLKGGSSVTLGDGRVIEPAEVCEPSHSGYPFLIIRCTNETELAQLIETLKDRSDILPSQNEGCLLLHDSPPPVIRSEAYRKLMQILAPDGEAIVKSVEEAQKMKAKRYSFYLQRDQEKEYPQPFVAVEALNRLLNESLGDVCGRTPDGDGEKDLFLQTIKLQDPQRWKKETGIDDATVAEKIQTRLDKIRARVPAEIIEEAKALPTRYKCDRDQPYVQLLGTGASIPSKYRNVSSTIVQVSDDRGILLDCGEGTLLQIAAGSSCYEEFITRIRSITFVFLSHKHADHIMGIQSLAAARHDLLTDSPLIICAAQEMHDWLRGVCLGPVTIRSCEEASVPSPVAVIPGMLEIRTCLVQHILKAQVPHGSYAIKLYITHQDTSFVVAFSGDLALTSKYQEFLAEDTPLDLLIQEATFEDFLKHEAVARQHCTVTDCLTAARWAKTKALVMTHFSQRYPTVPRVGEDVESDMCVCYGMDLLRVNLRREGQVDGAYVFVKRMLSSLAQWFACTTNDEAGGGVEASHAT